MSASSDEPPSPALGAAVLGGGSINDYEAVVLGAGITGLVSAAILLEQGLSRILIVDTYDHVGGNHLDRRIGPYTFDVGCFIFQDDSPLLRWFPELLDRYVPVEPSWDRINPRELVTKYPLSIRDDLLRAGPVELMRIFGSLALSRIRRRQPTNAKEFAEYWLGKRLVAYSGLADYMERFCGARLDRIDLAFAEQRMMWVSENARVKPLLTKAMRRLRRAPATNRQLARPREGFTHLYAPVKQRLEGSGVEFQLGTVIEAITKQAGAFALDGPGFHCSTPRLIATVPLDTTLGLLGQPRIGLPGVTLISLFFSFHGERGFRRPILYNFTNHGAWKRLTMYSDFYGLAEGREFFTVEVVALRAGYTVQEAEADFRADTAAGGLFVGDLVLEGQHELEHAYPVYVGGSSDRAAEGGRTLRAMGVESFGRQGGYRYQPTARASTIEAEDALGQPERTA